NEAAQLDACLRSLTFADAIVVVLDRTVDDSAKIAASHHAQIIEGAWEVEGARRNTGIDACADGWVLEVDADERVSSALAQEVRQVIANTPCCWFQVPIDNYVGARLIKYGWAGSFGTSATQRLFKKGHKYWGEQRVHPKVDLQGQGGWLGNALVHYVDRDISDMMKRLDRYTSAHASDLRANPQKMGSLPRNLLRALARFYKSYIRRKGYREGVFGVLLAIFTALYPIVSYCKARLEDDA
ncbi:MAG: glycosyltransferase family 2 protein, partial [Pseudomonadota bacterium]